MFCRIHLKSHSSPFLANFVFLLNAPRLHCTCHLCNHNHPLCFADFFRLRSLLTEHNMVPSLCLISYCWNCYFSFGSKRGEKGRRWKIILFILLKRTKEDQDRARKRLITRLNSLKRNENLSTELSVSEGASEKREAQDLRSAPGPQVSPRRDQLHTRVTNAVSSTGTGLRKNPCFV